MSNTLSQTTYQAIQEKLRAFGWSPCSDIPYEPSWSYQSKPIQTFQGTRTAIVYISDSSMDPYNAVLRATFESTGKNILEPHSALLPKDVTLDKLMEHVEQFCRGIDKAISEAFCVRILRSGKD